MKYLIFSDSHGDLKSIIKILSIFDNNKYDYLIHLGDVLYHGPRNDLPNSYSPKEVIKCLNKYTDKIICIKGNCDAEVDEMVLSFKIKKKIDLDINGFHSHLEHGHHLNKNKIFNDTDIVFYGHTHVSKIEKINNTYFINPGSISIPKENQSPSFICFKDNKIQIISLLSDEIIQEVTIPNK